MTRRVLAITLAGLLLAGPAAAQEEGDTIDDLLNKAQRYAESGRLKAGLDLYRKVLEQDPRNEAALFSLVILSEALQEFGDVVLFGSAYLFVAPEDPDRGQIMARVQAAEKKMVQSGRLQVKAQPADAEITLDGVPVGRGALALNLPAGRSFALRASAPDFVPWEEQVRLEAGEERTLAHRLDKIIYKGTLTARVIPDGAVDVYVDTRKVGTDTMKLTLTEGRRLVCFKKEGWDRWWRYVDVPRNGSTDLDVQLEQTTEMDGPCDVWPTED